MIITGDIASPNEAYSEELAAIFAAYPTIFAGKDLLFNLEGTISRADLTGTNTPVLYNHASLAGALEGFAGKSAGLANNHLLDLPENLADTLQWLQDNKISYAGAGENAAQAQAPICTRSQDKEVFIFNGCWDFLLYHQRNPTGGVHIATIPFKKMLVDVAVKRAAHPTASILIYLHWSLDLETLPYPMYRKFARELINAGANAVIGCHSHCVQGGEKYRDGYIVYGLGNFFLPNNVFANGRLFFPAWAATEMVFELDVITNEATCHWFQYEQREGRHTLKHLESSPFGSSPLLKQYSPFAGMDDATYLAYFKQKRRKRVLVPVFSDFQHDLSLRLQTGWLKRRAKFARAMASLRLIKWGS